MLWLEDGSCIKYSFELSGQWDYCYDGCVLLIYCCFLNKLGQDYWCFVRKLCHLNSTHHHLISQSRNLHDVFININFLNGNSQDFIWWNLPWFHWEMVPRSCHFPRNSNHSYYFHSNNWFRILIHIKHHHHMGRQRLHNKPQAHKDKNSWPVHWTLKRWRIFTCWQLLLHNSFSTHQLTLWCWASSSFPFNFNSLDLNLLLQ